MGTDTERQERLEGVLDNSGPQHPEGGPIPPQDQAPAIPPAQVAEMIIQYFNGYRKQHGLGPMNEVQAVLIRAGIMGTAEKYNMTFDIVAYPELALIGGAVWVGFDTFGEIKTKAKEEQRKREAEKGKAAETKEAA